jgi:hypothetical protein
MSTFTTTSDLLAKYKYVAASKDGLTIVHTITTEQRAPGKEERMSLVGSSTVPETPPPKSVHRPARLPNYSRSRGKKRYNFRKSGYERAPTDDETAEDDSDVCGTDPESDSSDTDEADWNGLWADYDRLKRARMTVSIRTETVEIRNVASIEEK